MLTEAATIRLDLPFAPMARIVAEVLDAGWHGPPVGIVREAIKYLVGAWVPAGVWIDSRTRATRQCFRQPPAIGVLVLFANSWAT
jgi:hypothetical protein